jgi:hypothetical protein
MGYSNDLKIQAKKVWYIRFFTKLATDGKRLFKSKKGDNNK